MSSTTRTSGKPAEPSLRLEMLEGQIALVTFDQPGSRANTLGQAVLAEFEALVQQLARRSDLKGLILRSGKPGMFIAGADLRELGSARPEPAQTRATIQRGHKLRIRISRIAEFGKPSTGEDNVALDAMMRHVENDFIGYARQPHSRSLTCKWHQLIQADQFDNRTFFHSGA